MLSHSLSETRGAQRPGAMKTIEEYLRHAAECRMLVSAVLRFASI